MTVITPSKQSNLQSLIWAVKIMKWYENS